MHTRRAITKASRKAKAGKVPHPLQCTHRAAAPPALALSFHEQIKGREVLALVGARCVRVTVLEMM